MKLATFTYQGVTRIGIVNGEAIVDLTAAAPEGARKPPSSAGGIPLSQVKLEAPIARPPEFLAIGLNYADHIAESGMKKPEFPLFFNKQSSCVTGPYDPIHLPRVSTQLDYEGELGFVIGRRCRNVPRDRAHEVIAGYVIVNDVSGRDWQRRAPAMTV